MYGASRDDAKAVIFQQKGLTKGGIIVYKCSKGRINVHDISRFRGLSKAGMRGNACADRISAVMIKPKYRS